MLAPRLRRRGQSAQPVPRNATGARQRGLPAATAYYHRYVILDIYSRYAVGWMVATRESAVRAEKLIAETCNKLGIGCGQLSTHADCAPR